MIHRRTDEHGTEIEDMVQDFDDARNSDDVMEESAKAFYEMLGVFKTSSRQADQAFSAGCHRASNGSEGSIQPRQRMLQRDDDDIWTLSTQRPCTACKPVTVRENPSCT